MAYGDDITEVIPYALSNPTSTTSYTPNAEAYDIAISGQPFFLMTNDETPYRRETAQYRKQQIDQTNEPGEQSITGWWVRAQSSFHKGEGINYYDPSAGETVNHRFYDSKGVNVWEKGKVTLLKSCTEGHITTGPIASNGRPQQTVRSIKWSGTNGILFHDEYDVDKIDVSGTVTHFIDYLTGSAEPVRAICDDGTYAYWLTNATEGGANKLHMFKKPLTGSSASTADETLMFTSTGLVITNAVMEYVKERIVACINNKVYEIPATATALTGTGGGTLVYTHSSSSYTYTSVAASGSAIYAAGYNGIQSTIQKFTLSGAGAMPVLASAVTAAEMPAGEIIHKIFYYYGYMMIGTSKGVRAATVSDTDGSIAYGPLIVETTQPCYDFAARDHYVWCATGVDGEPGIIRMNLDDEVEALRFAYANDLYYPGSTVHPTTGVAFAGDLNRLMFSTAHVSAADGHVYNENQSTLMPSGYIQTGRIRYATLENKVFKYLKPRIDNSTGGLTIQSISPANNEYTIGNFSQGDFTPEVGISYPAGAQEYLSFRFTLTRSTTVSTEGPVFTGYQLKALPAIPRQRLIQYPLACYDRELDALGIQVGYEGAAYSKLLELELTESAGDTVRIEDFRTGETFLGLIEQLQFINRTPSDKRFSGFGGTLLLTIRTL